MGGHGRKAARARGTDARTDPERRGTARAHNGRPSGRSNGPARFKDQNFRPGICGGDGKGGAWAVGAAYPMPAAAGPNVLSTADCQAPLAAVAQRLAHSHGNPAWVEIIKAHVTWMPWTLRFAVADAAGASSNGSPAPSLKELGRFKSFPTSNVHLLPPPGGEEPV